MEKYLPTGNEQISLPKLNEKNACLEDITFLHMACKGLIEIRGGDTLPLMQPFVNIDGKDMPLENIRWQRINFWIPCFSCRQVPYRWRVLSSLHKESAGSHLNSNCIIKIRPHTAFASGFAAAGVPLGIA